METIARPPLAISIESPQTTRRSPEHFSRSRVLSATTESFVAQPSPEQIESNSAPASSPLRRRIAKELRRAPATFAAPLVSRFDERGCMQRSSEACFVQPPSEKQFIHALQLAQRERRRKQPEGDGLLIDAGSHRADGDVDLPAQA